MEEAVGLSLAHRTPSMSTVSCWGPLTVNVTELPVMVAVPRPAGGTVAFEIAPPAPRREISISTTSSPATS